MIRNAGISNIVPICRWLADDLILDLTPTDAAILGFSNRWYRPALENVHSIRIGDHQIRVITALLSRYQSSKAFRGRGKNDFRSHDLEDVVTIIDGRTELVQEVVLAPAELRRTLSDEFQKLLSNRDFLDALLAYPLPDAASQKRLGQVVNRMRKMELEG